MIYIILIILGLSMGSFVNALVWRIYKKKDWVKERSVCTHCGHKLASKDLIPLFSWLELRGKCRYCHKKIDDSPLVELALPLLLVGSYIYWPYGFSAAGIVQFVLWGVILVILTALFVYDIRWMLLPNNLVYPLFALSALSVIVNSLLTGEVSTLLGAIVGALALGGSFWLLFQVSGGKWIGGGDVRIGFSLGALAGSLINSALLLFIASSLGSLVAIPILVKGGKKRIKSKIPFGPFLIIAVVVTYIFGSSIISWYQRLIYTGI